MDGGLPGGRPLCIAQTMAIHLARGLEELTVSLFITRGAAAGYQPPKKCRFNDGWLPNVLCH